MEAKLTGVRHHVSCWLTCDLEIYQTVCLCIDCELFIMASVDIRMMQPFNAEGDASSVSVRWTSYLEEFEAYADSKNLFITDDTDDNKAQQRALLLYTAGARVRGIFKDLPDKGDANDYKSAITALNTHFVVATKKVYQRHLFRTTVQNEGEMVAQYASRLRRAADGCEYGDVNDQMRDQIVSNCVSNQLRRKLLEKGGTLTLADTLRTAALHEALEQQTVTMTGKGQKDSSEQVNKIITKKPGLKKETGNTNNRSVKSWNCGYEGHQAKSDNCPAKGQTCKKCGKKGHFIARCPFHKEKKSSKVRHVAEGDSRDDGFAFHEYSVQCNNNDTIPISVGGVMVDFIVDSGCTSNIIDRKEWEKCKSNNIVCESRACTKKLFAYGASAALPVVGCFDAVVVVNEKSVKTEFVVVEGDGPALLGRKTSEDLGVLKVGIGINNIAQDCSELKRTELSEQVRNENLDVMTGVGKLKGVQMSFTVDPKVKPVAQQLRRTPFGLRESVEKKLQSLIDQDVIERVEKPSEWVSPVVIAPKKDNDVRICVDLRRVNQAIMRERHPIPTVDEALLEMSRSRVFSKIDLKWGYHQIELSEEAREVTTFVTHMGLFRYRRLPFGVNVASEAYQRMIHNVLQGIPGVVNISDDIAIHTPDLETHR